MFHVTRNGAKILPLKLAGDLSRIPKGQMLDQGQQMET